MTTTLLKSVQMPDRVAKLPRDRHGYPVPWFVAWIDDKPDFRVIGSGKLRDSVHFGLCWICGQHRGRWGTFVIGPMCAVNRISAEPPSHAECADYAAKVCPFLTTPSMRRRDSNKPVDAQDPAGMMIRRNPGVALLWRSRSWRLRKADGLFDVGDPDGDVRWLCEGRDATRDEVMQSIESGLPILQQAAERDGRQAVELLNLLLDRALDLVPTGVTTS